MSDPVTDPVIKKCEGEATGPMMIAVVFLLMLGLGATVTTKQMKQ